MRFELSTKLSTGLGLLQSEWSFHPRPAMCMKFWFDLADVYEVLLLTTALPRWATHHTSANEHDELRRSVDLPGCLSSHRRRRFDQMRVRTKTCSVKVGQMVNTTSESTVTCHSAPNRVKKRGIGAILKTRGRSFSNFGSRKKFKQHPITADRYLAWLSS